MIYFFIYLQWERQSWKNWSIIGLLKLTPSISCYEYLRGNKNYSYCLSSFTGNKKNHWYYELYQGRHYTSIEEYAIFKCFWNYDYSYKWIEFSIIKALLFIFEAGRL